jgi:hypothetical protein
LRVLHILSAFTAAMTYDQQRLLWYSDTDQINEDAKDRSFADTQTLSGNIGAMYMTHGFDVLGFGTSFRDKSYLDDLPRVVHQIVVIGKLRLLQQRCAHGLLN